MRRAIRSCRPCPRLAKAKAVWVGYLSTTGVYGDHDGGWVDEATPLTPQSGRGRRVLAEGQWQATGLPVHIFRLAGILRRVRPRSRRSATAPARRIIKTGQVFNRIHVDDIARVLEASIPPAQSGAAYNVCDDNPCPPQEVIGYAARLLGMPEPPAVPFEAVAPTMTPMALGFYSRSKRVRNDRIKDELGVKLLYPDYPVWSCGLAGRRD